MHSAVFRRPGSRGTTLIEAILALAILGVVVLFGTSFFVKRRELERERLDRDAALRALRSEWAYLRTAAVAPVDGGPFIGSRDFLDTIASRNPKLTARPAGSPGLLFVHMEITCGVRRARRLAQEGYVYSPGLAFGGTP